MRPRPGELWTYLIRDVEEIVEVLDGVTFGWEVRCRAKSYTYNLILDERKFVRKLSPLEELALAI